MSKLCEVCGKKPVAGRSIIRHGIPKKKGGIGLHTRGINARRFVPNLQKIRVRQSSGSVKRMQVCVRCIRAGKIAKA
jgi:large subunit ribosomal protein L28